MSLETEIERLVIEIQDLVRVLDQTSGTAGSRTSGASLAKIDSTNNRLINAIGLLATTLDKGTKSNISNQKSIDAFVKEVDEATKRQTDSNKKTKDSVDLQDKLNKAHEEALRLDALSKQEREKQISADRLNLLSSKLADSRRRKEGESWSNLIDTYGRAGSAGQTLADQFLAVRGTSLGVQLGLQGVLAAGSGLAAGFFSYGKAIYNGERGLKPFAKAITEATKPVVTLGETISAVAMAIAFLPGIGLAVRVAAAGISLLSGAVAKATKTMAELNEASAEQTMTLFKEFNKLSRAGIAVRGGLQGVYELTHSMFLTVKEMDEFSKLLSQNTDKLAMFGATAGQGAERFAKAAGIMVTKYGEELENLGIERDEQRESMLAYMSLQAKAGTLGIKNAQQLAVEGAKFTKELDLSAQIMGTSREAQQKAIDANLADAKFRAAMLSAEKRGDVAEMARLERANQVAAALRSAGMAEDATGVIQYAGGTRNEQAMAAYQQYGLQDLDNPNLTVNQLLGRMAKSSATMNTNMSDVLIQMGNIPSLTTSSLAKNIDWTKMYAELEKEAGAKGLDVDKYLETEQGKKSRDDKQREQLIKAGRLQQNAAMDMEDSIRSFSKSNDVFDAATKLFAKSVGYLPGAGAAGPRAEGGAPGAGAVPVPKGLQAPPPGAPAPGTQGSSIAPTVGPKALTAEGRRAAARTSWWNKPKTESAPATATGAEDKKTFGQDVAEKQAALASTGVYGKPATAGAIKSIIESGKGYIIVGTENGNQRREGTAAWRNNNPGNLRFNDYTKGLGAIGGDYQGFAVFPTMSAGESARTKMLFEGRYKNMSISDAISRYAPVSDNNDVQKYIGVVTNATGASPQTKLSDLSDSQRQSLLTAMAKHEGITPGTVTSAAFGGVFAGPKSGYTALLHGTEAVIPMSADRKMPVDVSGIADSMNQVFAPQMQAMQAQISRLDELVSLMRRQATTGERMLQIKQA